MGTKRRAVIVTVMAVKVIMIPRQPAPKATTTTMITKKKHPYQQHRWWHQPTNPRNNHEPLFLRNIPLRRHPPRHQLFELFRTYGYIESIFLVKDPPNYRPPRHRPLSGYQTCYRIGAESFDRRQIPRAATNPLSPAIRGMSADPVMVTRTRYAQKILYSCILSNSKFTFLIGYLSRIVVRNYVYLCNIILY